MSEPQCVYRCGRPLDKLVEPLRHEITGWETDSHTRSTGTRGGSDIGMRTRTGAMMHESCFQLMKRGVHPGQGSLLDE
jgi:hypothetical protein